MLTHSIEAQDQPAKPPPPAIPQRPLQIFILDGQHAVNVISTHESTTPVVEIRDENDYPLEGVEVRFALPATGPGGVFEDGQKVKVTKTNVEGQASAPFIVNGEQGTFDISVTATRELRSARAIISETNSLLPVVEKHHGPWYKNWKIMTVIACAATAGIVVLATRHTSSPTIVISPGTPTFSGPQ